MRPRSARCSGSPSRMRRCAGGQAGPRIAPVVDGPPDIARRIELIRGINQNPERVAQQILDSNSAPMDWQECLSHWRSYREVAEARSATVDPGLVFYIHIPLCFGRCTYCDCSTRTLKSPDQLSTYLESLEIELDRYRPAVEGWPIRAMSVGGGTPSLLTAEQTDRLLSKVFSIFPKADDFFFNVEFNPHSTTLEKLKSWRSHGVERVSFGVQTLTRRVLDNVNRGYQTTESVQQAVAWAREAGIDAVNLDLLAGLPGETEESFIRTLEACLDFGPDYLTVFRWVLDSKIPYLAQRESPEPGLLERIDRVLTASHEHLTHRRWWWRSNQPPPSGGGARSSTGFRRLVDSWLARRYRATVFGAWGYEVKSLSSVRTAARGNRYEKLRSLGRALLAIGHTAASTIPQRVDYLNEVPWQEYLQWPREQGSAPFKGNRRTPELSMAAYWAARLDATGRVSRSRFRSTFDTVPEQAFPRELEYLRESKLIRLSNDFYSCDQQVSREDKYVAGTLLFSEQDLLAGQAQIERVRESYGTTRA